MSALIQLFALQKLHKSHQKQSSEGCDWRSEIKIG